MSSITNALSAEILSYLVDLDRRPLGVSGSRSRRALIARLRVEMEALPLAPNDVVEATRTRWSGDYRVAILDQAEMRIDRNGIWVSGWLLAGRGFPDQDPIDPGPLAAALCTLPVLQREVFVLHRRDGLTLDAIGERLGIARNEVRAALSAALMSLDDAFPSDRP